jgi:hypothetical protein
MFSFPSLELARFINDFYNAVQRNYIIENSGTYSNIDQCNDVKHNITVQ